MLMANDLRLLINGVQLPKIYLNLTQMMLFKNNAVSNEAAYHSRTRLIQESNGNKNDVIPASKSTKLSPKWKLANSVTSILFDYKQSKSILLNIQGMCPNANSASSYKLQYLVENYVNRNPILYIAITESWLKPHLQNAQIF